MADLTQRNNHARHREHDRKLRDLDRRVAAAQKAVDDLIAAGAQPAIIENAKARFEALEKTQEVFSQQLLDAEKRLDGHDDRLDNHDLRLSRHDERIESVEVRSNAHASAIAELRQQLDAGFLPTVVVGVVTFFLAWLVFYQWHPLARAAVLAGVVALIAAGLATAFAGSGHSASQVTAQTSSGATATTGYTPVPTADVPPVPPRPTTQQPVTGTRAAASATSQASVN